MVILLLPRAILICQPFYHPNQHPPARHCSFTSQWPMRLSPETAEFEAELEILGRPVSSAAGRVGKALVTGGFNDV